MVRIYTRTGDAGETGLFDGTRVSKADPRVDAYGDVDELASWLGVVRARTDSPDLIAMITHIQRDLFALGARLADPRRKIAGRVEKVVLTEQDVTARWGKFLAVARGFGASASAMRPKGGEFHAPLLIASLLCLLGEAFLVRRIAKTRAQTA